MYDPNDISVIIPTHNRAHTLARAIDSVLQQTQMPGEIIVVDDDSTDDTRGVLKDYEGRVSLLRLQKRSGAAAARNRGLAFSRGPLIAFLDSDDAWLPLKIERQLQAINKNAQAIGAVYCAIVRIDSMSGEQRLVPLSSSRPTLAELCSVNVVGSTSTVLAKKSLVDAIGGFDETLPASQDWDLWLRLRQQDQILGVDEPLVRYFDHPGQISAKVDLVFDGRRLFFLKHSTLIESNLSPQLLSQWQRSLARLAVLCGRFHSALEHQQVAWNRGGRISDYLLLQFVNWCPGVLRWAAVLRRRFLHKISR